MTKSYSGNAEENRNDAASVADKAAKRAEEQVDDIKKEAHDEVKKQQEKNA